MRFYIYKKNILKTFCIFHMEIIVKVRATTLNIKIAATGTPRTSRSAFPFEIQQNTLASKGGGGGGGNKIKHSISSEANKFLRPLTVYTTLQVGIEDIACPRVDLSSSIQLDISEWAQQTREISSWTRKFPKITEDSRRYPRKIRWCFDHTATNLSLA